MDPVTALAIGKGAIDIFSAFSAKKGQKDSNMDQMAFNAMEAEKARNFEERMFSTRYQTTRKDLEAAGYNPIMALGGPTSVPNSAAASATPQNENSQAAAIVSNSARSAAEVMLTREMAETEKSKQKLNLSMASGRVGIPGFGSIPVSSAVAAANSMKKAGPAGAGQKIAKWMFT